MYFIGGWDVVILQEQSQIPSVAEEVICHWSYPYAKQLSEEIHNSNPNAKIQWFLTWVRFMCLTFWPTGLLRGLLRGLLTGLFTEI